MWSAAVAVEMWESRRQTREASPASVGRDFQARWKTGKSPPAESLALRRRDFSPFSTGRHFHSDLNGSELKVRSPRLSDLPPFYSGEFTSQLRPRKAVEMRGTGSSLILVPLACTRSPGRGSCSLISSLSGSTPAPVISPGFLRGISPPASCCYSRAVPHHGSGLVSPWLPQAYCPVSSPGFRPQRSTW